MVNSIILTLISLILIRVWIFMTKPWALSL